MPYKNPEDKKRNRREYYQLNKEEIKRKNTEHRRNNRPAYNARTKLWKQANKDKLRDKEIGYRKALRDRFLEMYGRQCACCGETTDKFLTVEHVQGQIGIKKKESGQDSHRKAVSDYRPDLYKVLCFNCNCAKSAYGYCPHEMKETKGELHENL